MARQTAGVLAVLGLGSNRGDSRGILEAALGVLGAEVLGDLRRSSFYRTAPVGPPDQGWFLNAAAAGRYPGSPAQLLEDLHRIEAAFGRDRSRERRWGERSLDIDILLFGDLVVSDPPVLEIPHPRLRERAFALVPLLELLPEAKDPLDGQSYRAVFAALPPQGIRREE